MRIYSYKKRQSKSNIKQINIKLKSAFPHLNQEDTTTSQMSSKAWDNEKVSLKDTLTTKYNKRDDSTNWKPKRNRYTRLTKYIT